MKTTPLVGGLSRRRFLARTRDLALLALLPEDALAEHVHGAAAHPEAKGVFLSVERLRALRALCAHFIPGPPEDPDPGAREAGAAEYIDLLLGAFTRPVPPIFAGGPFSHREGGGPNHFAEFLRLDALEERIWRTRIEGSQGRPEREWNGPVKGWQESYAEGLDALDASARRYFRRPFAELSRWQREATLVWIPGVPDEFVELAFAHTLEGTYGAPEYGGNKDRVSWGWTRWPGDHQPRAYTRAEISEPDPE
jgi:hypothetical protein